MFDIVFKHPYLTAIITSIVGFLFMPLVLKFARSRNMVVRPNKRTSHEGAVPNIGGLNIFISLFVVFVPLIATGYMRVPFFIGFCLIFLIGFIDDRLVLSAYWKIVGESLCAFFLIYFADIRITSFHGILGIYEIHPLISYGVSFCIYILITNALNLIDGVDGLASGLGILYCSFFGTWFLLAGMHYYSIVCFAVIGSLTVFFLYNVFGRSRRKIFMGDSGSLMLGYIITATGILFLEANKVPTATAPHFPFAPVSLLAIIFIPIFDVFRVSITRVKNKKIHSRSRPQPYTPPVAQFGIFAQTGNGHTTYGNNRLFLYGYCAENLQRVGATCNNGTRRLSYDIHYMAVFWRLKRKKRTKSNNTILSVELLSKRRIAPLLFNC